MKKVMINYQKRKNPTKENMAANAISQKLGIEPLTAQLLASRGVNTADEANVFLYPDIDQLHSPFLFQNMQKCVQRIERAIQKEEKITVYCDYDTDGTTGAASLILYLEGRKAKAAYYTPDRHSEGYGMNMPAIDAIADDGCGLIITIDCGITNIDEVAAAKRRGVDVIITDHHECQKKLPDTPYIINPKMQGSSYPYRHLCGAGVVFKLIEALGGRAEALTYIDLAAVGTIADIVPLTGENRVIAKYGLKKLREDPGTGLKLLAQAAGLDMEKLNAYHISFGIAPRLNAAGRMDTAKTAIELLISKEENDEGRRLAAKLDDLNTERKSIEKQILDEAKEMILSDGDLNDKKAVLLYKEGWNTGVIGIVASDLVESVSRPRHCFQRKRRQADGVCQNGQRREHLSCVKRVSSPV